MKLWRDFNDWIGTKVAIFLSSMGGFWVIMALTILPLTKQQPHGIIEWVMYVVQTIFQGAALPLLGYVSDRGTKAIMQLIQEMHDIMLGKFNNRIDDIEDKVTEELKLLQEENKNLMELLIAIIELSETRPESGKMDITITENMNMEKVFQELRKRLNRQAFPIGKMT